MWRFRLSRCLALAGAIGVVAGCRHAPAPTLEGRSAFEILAPKPPPRPPRKSGPTTDVPQPRDVLIEAEPIEPLATPVFPPMALGKPGGNAMVGVRITVDANGRVSNVGTSLAAISTPGPFTAEFRVAVETAVRQWRFLPAEIRHLEPAMENGKYANYWNVTKNEKTEVTLDVAFTFRTSGDVLSGWRK